MKYNYFEKSTISVVDSVSNTFKNFGFTSSINKSQPFPVYIQTTGDNKYMSINSDRLVERNKTDAIYMPSIVLKIEGIDIDESARTNEIDEGKYVLELNGHKSERVKQMSTYPCTVRMSGVVFFSNIFQYFSFFEYCMNGVYKRIPFRFTYMGKTQDAEWTLDTSSMDIDYEEVGLFGSDDGNHQTSISIEAYLQYPSFNLNNTLGGNVDSDGDGYNEGGIGGNGGDVGFSTDNVIKTVYQHTDIENINNKVNTVIIKDEK